MALLLLSMLFLKFIHVVASITNIRKVVEKEQNSLFIVVFLLFQCSTLLCIHLSIDDYLDGF